MARKRRRRSLSDVGLQSLATIADRINALIDEALVAENAARPSRIYLGGSRLGVACERALAVRICRRAQGRRPRLRRPDAAHLCRRSPVSKIWPSAGCARPGSSSTPPRATDRTASSSVSRSPAAAFAAMWTASSPLALCLTGFPRSGNASRSTTNPGRIRQARRGDLEAGLRRSDRDLSGLHGSDRAGHFPEPGAVHRHQQGHRGTHHELVPFDGGLAQTVSDKAVRIIQATEGRRAAAAHRPVPRFLRVPVLLLVGSLLEGPTMPDTRRHDNVIALERWRDFNDAEPQRLDDSRTVGCLGEHRGDQDPDVWSISGVVLSYLLPGGVFQAGKFLVGDVQGNRGDSLSVELDRTQGRHVARLRDRRGRRHHRLSGRRSSGQDTRTDFPAIMDDIRAMARWPKPHPSR